MEEQSGGAERGQNGREKEEREGGIIEKAFPVAQASHKLGSGHCALRMSTQSPP